MRLSLPIPKVEADSLNGALALAAEQGVEVVSGAVDGVVKLQVGQPEVDRQRNGFQTSMKNSKRSRPSFDAIKLSSPITDALEK
jgi:hypothetical protein